MNQTFTIPLPYSPKLFNYPNPNSSPNTEPLKTVDFFPLDEIPDYLAGHPYIEVQVVYVTSFCLATESCLF